MGRVYDALKRAAAQSHGDSKVRTTANTKRRSVGAGGELPPAAREIERELMAGSSILTTPDAARIEPHLVAITQPRSGYNEQYRALRTRVLQAGEHQQMRTFVITSAGVGEGKTLKIGRAHV